MGRKDEKVAKTGYARQFLFLGKGTSKNFLKDNPNILNMSKRKKRTSLQNKTGSRIHTEKSYNNKAPSSKFINLNSQMKTKANGKKKRSHIFFETENSFLARIWPEKSHLLKKESIYETMAKHNKRQKKLKAKEMAQFQELKELKSKAVYPI